MVKSYMVNIRLDEQQQLSQAQSNQQKITSPIQYESTARQAYKVCKRNYCNHFEASFGELNSRLSHGNSIQCREFKLPLPFVFQPLI